MSMPAADCQAAEEEAGGAEEDERHGDLGDEEDVAEAPSASGAGEGVFSFERVGEDGARGDPGRDEAEEKAGGYAKHEGVEEDSPIDAYGEIEWNGRGEVECREATGCCQGEEDSEDAAGEGEEDAFEEHLAEETGPGGSEGDADGHLTLTAVGLGEEEIGDVGAGDAKDQKRYDQEGREEEEDGGSVAWWEGAGLFEGELEVFFGGGVGGDEVFGEGCRVRRPLDRG